MQQNNVEISIVMPVRNMEDFITTSTQSILNQSFSDFELIIINNNSSDGTIKKIKEIQDERVILKETHKGYISALNIGLQSASGKYIARMDADDYMHPDRLRLQYNFMENNQNIDICSTWAKVFNRHSKIHKELKAKPGLVRNPLIELWKSNFVIHPTAFMRKTFIHKNKIKYQNYFAAEDYKLWYDFAHFGARFFVLPQFLHYYQAHEHQTSWKHRTEQIQTSQVIQDEIEDLLFKRYPSVYKSIINLRTLRKKRLLQEDLYRQNIFFLLQTQNILLDNERAF